MLITKGGDDDELIHVHQCRPFTINRYVIHKDERTRRQQEMRYIICIAFRRNNDEQKTSSIKEFSENERIVIFSEHKSVSSSLEKRDVVYSVDT
jgi:hypothetical protein